MRLPRLRSKPSLAARLARLADRVRGHRPRAGGDALKPAAPADGRAVDKGGARPSNARSRSAPPPKRAEVKARLRLASAKHREMRLNRLSALGYVALAGMILAWPRAGGSPLDRLVLRLRSPHGVLALTGADPVVLAERAEPQRGRDAVHPLKIPEHGWRDIASRVAANFGRNRIAATAAGVTFFSLLAMFPALAAFVSLYGLFADVHSAREQLRLLSGFIPHDTLNFVGDEILRIADGKKGGLGVAFVVSLLFSLWSANGAVKALFDGLNVAYEERETRGFVKLNLVSLAFTLFSLLFAAIAFAAIVAAPVALHFLRLDAGSAWLAELRWPVMLALLAGGLSLVYRFGPSREQARWVWLTPGSLFAAVMWVAASLAFSFYVANFGHYNATYGSLGAVIGFLTWLWYSTTIVLVGAELNSEVEHQTAVDTTTGPHRAMGDRGAKMADTLGETRDTMKAGKRKRPPPRRAKTADPQM